MKLLILSMLIGMPLIAQTSTASNTAPAHIIAYKRFSKGFGGANPLFCDDIRVASLRNKDHYFVLEIPPGKHYFRSNSTRGNLIIHAEPGQTYFLEVVSDFSYFKFVHRTEEESELILDMITSGKMLPIDPKDIQDHTHVLLALPPSVKAKETN